MKFCERCGTYEVMPVPLKDSPSVPEKNGLFSLWRAFILLSHRTWKALLLLSESSPNR